jgi:hypothetical protein
VAVWPCTACSTAVGVPAAPACPSAPSAGDTVIVSQLRSPPAPGVFSPRPIVRAPPASGQQFCASQTLLGNSTANQEQQHQTQCGLCLPQCNVAPSAACCWLRHLSGTNTPLLLPIPCRMILALAQISAQASWQGQGMSTWHNTTDYQVTARV